MKKIILFFFITLSIYPVFSQQTPSSLTFKTYWKNGINIESSNKKFKIKIGGRLQYDAAYIAQDREMKAKFGGNVNGVEFRRSRLLTKGTIYGNINYKIDFEFAGGKAGAKDMFIEITKIPIAGNIRVGKMKEPFGFETQMSGNFFTFMERPFSSDFNRIRNTGLMTYNFVFNKKMLWQAGIFRDASSFGDDKNAKGGFTFTARAAGLLIQNKSKNRVLHFGGAYSYQKPKNNKFALKSRPEAHLAPKYLNFNTNFASHISKVEGEIVYVEGAFSIQGEYTAAILAFDANQFLNNKYFQTFYGQISYFLTGENKNFKNSLVGFSRVKPNKNFGDGGIGAWEIGARYSYADLNDGIIFGGKQSDISIALNWLLNPSTKIMFNYVLAHLNGIGNSQIAQMRFQIDF